MLGLNSRPALKSAANAARLFSASARRDFSRLTMVGRMGTKPETAQTSDGREIVRYVVASNTGTKDKPITSWFRVTNFNPNQHSRLLSIPKGSLVLVESDASFATREDETGRRVQNLMLAHRNITLLKRPANNDAREDQGQHGGEQ
ncbi:hypothetical protein VTO42DRAFT_2119 [Malbranchea cinnamomea]